MQFSQEKIKTNGVVLRQWNQKTKQKNWKVCRNHLFN